MSNDRQVNDLNHSLVMMHVTYTLLTG
jgi:hypothetical protein